MISGLAAAETNNGVGIAALGWESQIMPLQVTEWKGNGIPPAPDASVRFCAKAVKWAVDHYAHVINMSFGGNPNFQCWGMEAFKDGCGFAYKLNLILTASAGNNPAYGVHFPARWGPVIAVGATDENDTRWEKSSYGPEMELCAPGVNILTTLKTGPSSFSYGRGTGTSMSAPLVAATAALCRAKWPAATAAQIRKIMQGFSDDLGKTGFDWEYGYGRINPARIFKAAEGKTLTEVVAAAEEEIEERNALGVRYGAYVDPSIPNAVAEP
jgi:subtilisin family serine protease